MRYLKPHAFLSILLIMSINVKLYAKINDSKLDSISYQLQQITVTANRYEKISLKLISRLVWSKNEKFGNTAKII